MSENREGGLKSSTDVWELYRADFASSDECRNFVLLPTFDRGSIPGNAVKVVQATRAVSIMCEPKFAGGWRT